MPILPQESRLEFYLQGWMTLVGLVPGLLHLQYLDLLVITSHVLSQKVFFSRDKESMIGLHGPTYDLAAAAMVPYCSGLLVPGTLRVVKSVLTHSLETFSGSAKGI